MQELVVIGDTVYFRSVYEREADPFYQLLEPKAYGDRDLCSMKLDGTGRQRETIPCPAKDTLSWSDGNYNRGIFVVNGRILARYFEDQTKGVLWHI